MGSVVSFAPRDAATRKPIAGGVTASVIIFPGVRYERQQASTPTIEIPVGTMRPDQRPDKLPPHH